MSTLLNYLMGLCVFEARFEWFRIECMSKVNKQLIKSINKRQQKKFIDRTTVPIPLLEVFWDMDYLPGNRPPREGMCVKGLLDYLTNGLYRDERHRTRGIWLRDLIEAEEYPEHVPDDGKVVMVGQKFIPVFYLRDIPGTIFR